MYVDETNVSSGAQGSKKGDLTPCSLTMILIYVCFPNVKCSVGVCFHWDSNWVAGRFKHSLPTFVLGGGTPYKVANYAFSVSCKR